MAEQYKVGNVQVANASILVIGDGTDWANEINLPAIFKVNLDGEATYSVATIMSATRLHLSANYGGTTDSGLGYQLCRSFTTNRSYWRPLQGDDDWAEILSQETIDKIDTDIAVLYTSMTNANASIAKIDGFSSPTELTIDNGSIIVSGDNKWRFHSIDTQGDTASDDLSIIHGGNIAEVFMLQAEDSARTINCKKGTSLKLQADFSLSNAEDKLEIVCASPGIWHERFRSTWGG